MSSFFLIHNQISKQPNFHSCNQSLVLYIYTIDTGHNTHSNVKDTLAHKYNIAVFAREKGNLSKSYTILKSILNSQELSKYPDIHIKVITAKRVLYKKLARKYKSKESLIAREKEVQLSYDTLVIAEKFPSSQNISYALSGCASALLDYSTDKNISLNDKNKSLNTAFYFANKAQLSISDKNSLKISLLSTKGRILYNLVRVKESMENLDYCESLFWDNYKSNRNLLGHRSEYHSEYENLFTLLRFTALNINYGQIAYLEKNYKLAKDCLSRVLYMPDPNNFAKRRKKISLNLLKSIEYK